MKLKADFVNDWMAVLKDILVNHWGYDTTGIPDDEIPLVYFNAELRRIEKRLRKIEYATGFSCPDELKKGLEVLKNKIETGQDITPNLSKLVLKPQNMDSLLNDWGVHHFHLGEDLEGNFIKRTKPLLFALVTNNIFYVIGIFSHGEWANDSIVEIIHKNWPESISQYKVKEDVQLSYNLTSEERLKFRKNQLNSYFQCSDGTLYAPVGGGSVTSGYNVQSTIRMIQQKKHLKNLENFLEGELPRIRSDLEKQGYGGEEELVTKLEITETQYNAFFPKYNLSVILHKRA
ncbi:MAG: hypothetical protein WCO53_09300 [Deltaproteobacteria bacterium]